MTRLWHYTCEHGRVSLGDENTVVPIATLMAGRIGARSIPPTGQYVWFTDLASPQRHALGLTMNILACDRTAHRYRVLEGSDIAWWPNVRGLLQPDMVADLEGAEGAQPDHWWISSQPVPVVYDPVTP